MKEVTSIIPNHTVDTGTITVAIAILIPGYDDYYAEEYLEDIKTVAAMYGEDPEVIQELYNDGYTLEELEEMIYT